MTFRMFPKGRPMQKQELSGPLVDVEQVSQSGAADLNTWNISWRIGNLGSHTLQILSVRLPHGRFRGKEINVLPIQELGPGESTLIEIPVVCKESPGTEVENAFFILRIFLNAIPLPNVMSRIESRP